MALGQGRENAKDFLAGNPALLKEIDVLIRQQASLPALALSETEAEVVFD